MVGRRSSVGSVLKIAQMRGNRPSGTTGCSSAQIRKSPPKKKRLLRHQIKARLHPRRRPAKSPAQPKLGKGRKRSARNLNTGRRMTYTRSQETRLKTCYCTFSGAVAKFPLKSSLRTGPAKAPKKPNLGWPNTSGAKAEERHPSGKRMCKGETLQPPLSEKPKELTSAGEIQRKSKPTTAGNRRYQAVSEYQFIYPEKSMFHLNGETGKQKLRTIYRRSQKQSKQTWTTPCPSDCNLARRGYPWNYRHKCPIGGTFLKDMQASLTLRGLSSLTCRINKLVLVSEKPPAAPPKAPPVLEGKQHPLQARCPPAFEQPYLSADAVQQPCSSPENQASSEGCLVDQGAIPDALVQENAPGFSSRACCAESPEPSPLLGKDCYAQGSDVAPGGKSQYVAYPENEDAAAPNELDLNINRNLEIARAESAIAVLRISQLLSSEDFGRETPLDLSFLTEGREPEHPCAALEESEGKLDGGFASQPCEGKGEACSLGGPPSRNSEPSGAGSWEPRTQDSLRSCSD
ncbi:hypothetical protein lerEdw1_006780 [Lerista edwardsae]|nr:hypothetical protein lerEdw1_006780 [Lerista edwardsae]